ncbi:MAG: NAD-binding protein [Cyanobacteriota bacterium]|nr:NAD-binding protein [Cyanobacteriota bacterium]
MYLIIVGANPISRSLISLAIENNHQVVVIERDAEPARTMLAEHDIKVFQVDIAAKGVLEEAQADKADALFAITKDDSTNLMAIFLAKKQGVKQLIAMVNNNEHQAMFESLGVNVIAAPETIVAQHIFSFLKE